METKSITVYAVTKDAVLWRSGVLVRNHSEAILAIADGLDSDNDVLLVLDGDHAGSIADMLWICGSQGSGFNVRRPAQRFYEPNLLTAVGSSLYALAPDETSEGIARVEAILTSSQVETLAEHSIEAEASVKAVADSDPDTTDEEVEENDDV